MQVVTAKFGQTRRSIKDSSTDPSVVLDDTSVAASADTDAIYGNSEIMEAVEAAQALKGLQHDLQVRVNACLFFQPYK